AGKVALRVAGASPKRPALHVCFSESRASMALQPGQNEGETDYAPGCDTANINNGLPGVSYTYDSDSHQLALPARLPGVARDAQLPHADGAQEVIFDGGKRDRIVWQGDLAVQAPVTFLSSDDRPAVDNSLSSLAAQQLPDGYVPAESLVGPHNTGEERTYGE